MRSWRERRWRECAKSAGTGEGGKPRARDSRHPPVFGGKSIFAGRPSLAPFLPLRNGDWVEMGKLLKKLMKHTMTFVESRHFSRQLKTDFRNSPAMRRNVPDRTEFLKPTFCLVDENSRDLREDPEMVGISFPANCQFFFVVRYLLLRDQLEPAKTLLVAYRKTYDFLLSSRQSFLRPRIGGRRDDSRRGPAHVGGSSSVSVPRGSRDIGGRTSGVSVPRDDVFVGGESALDDTIWPYSVHVMLLGGSFVRA